MASSSYHDRYPPGWMHEQQWRVTVDQHPLSATLSSEPEARNAMAAEVVRLDAVALALLRRTRSRSTRKQS